MAENEKVAAIVINKQAGLLYERFRGILTEKGKAHVEMVEEGLKQGTIVMTPKEITLFEKYKKTPICYGVERYLQERFTPEKTGIDNTREMGDYIQEHGWVRSFTTPYHFGSRSAMDSHIEEYEDMAREFPHASEAYGKLIANLEGQKEITAISAIAEGYAEGAIPTEVAELDDQQLWQYATGGGFASVEVSWAQKQDVLIKEATRLENETVFEPLGQ